ncbi:MAG: PadR family transcriptional regulator [Clostridiales bacterium]|nr:PadR family transcriptional regulator [Clostridiales bacterium]
MEYIILGLLLLQSRTIYQLRKRINEGLNLMYSCSTGSIQAAIKKLLKSGYIRVDEIVENGKQKKLYSITEAGKTQFNAWVNSAIDNNAGKNPELAKVYFMGFSEKDNRIKLIQNHIHELQNALSTLENICEDGEDILADSQENDILFYQLQTAKYGRDLIRFNIDWYNKLLENIREN